MALSSNKTTIVQSFNEWLPEVIKLQLQESVYEWHNK